MDAQNGLSFFSHAIHAYPKVDDAMVNIRQLLPRPTTMTPGRML
jgi:hypothetical protein